MTRRYTAFNRRILASWAVALVLVILVAAAAGAISLALLLAPASLLLGSWSSGAELRLGSDSFEIRTGWPSRRVARVAYRDVLGVSAREFGQSDLRGWRRRGRLDTAIVVRRGPAVLIESRGNRRFLVTVDRAEEAADRLRELAVGSRA